MIDVHLYGHLKKLYNPDLSFFNDEGIKLTWKSDETVEKLILRLNLSIERIGECFINGTVVNDLEITIIPQNARVAIFPLGMHLLCGGQHLKGHGFITKRPKVKLNYYHEV